MTEQQNPRLDELQARHEQARQGGGQARIDQQHAKGKMTARERIAALLDPGTFQELQPFTVATRDDSDAPPGDGVVTGFGADRRARASASTRRISRSYGGSVSLTHARKITQIQDMALQQRRAHHRPARLRRRAHPGGRDRAPGLRRNLPLQRAGLRRDPADLRDDGAVRGWRVVQPRAHRLHRDGGQDVHDVHHRPGRGQKRHRRRRSTTKGWAARASTLTTSGVAHFIAEDEEEALALVRRLLAYLAVQQRRRPAAVADRRRPDRAPIRASTPSCPTTPTCPTICTR